MSASFLSISGWQAEDVHLQVDFCGPRRKLVKGHGPFCDVAEFAARHDVPDLIASGRVDTIYATASDDVSLTATISVTLERRLSAVAARLSDQFREFGARECKGEVSIFSGAFVAVIKRVCYRTLVSPFSSLDGLTATAWVLLAELIGGLLHRGAAITNALPHPIAVRFSAREREEREAPHFLIRPKFRQDAACQ